MQGNALLVSGMAQMPRQSAVPKNTLPPWLNGSLLSSV